MRKHALAVAISLVVGALGSGAALAQGNNKAPVARADSATTAPGAAVTVNVLANDSDSNRDPLTVTSNTAPPNGMVSRSGGTITYTPAPGFTGTDTFNYTISDGRGGTATARVTVTVAVANLPPVANADSAAATTATPVSINLLANDSDPNGDTLSVTANTNPANGTVTRSGGVATYTSAAGFTGTNSFNYTLSDGKGGTATGSVTVTVSPPPNRPPVATADSAGTAAATPVSINLLANDSDPDGDTVSVTVNTNPSNGTVSRSGGTATYTPAAGFAGTDSFSYSISDGKGGTGNATVTVSVAQPVNNPPVAAADSASTAFGTAVSINLLANDSDPNGDTLTVSSNTSPANGSVTRSGGTANYTPAPGFSGTDSFGYTISDGKGGTANSTVSVTVAPKPNTAPAANADMASTAFATPVSINLVANDSDPDGDTLTVTANTSPANGSVTRSGGSATYTPAAGFSGSDSFGYTVSDGKGGTANGTVSVTVAPKPNTPPSASGDSASTAFQTPVSINLLANDSDPDGDTLTVTANTSPANGSVTRSGGSATYTPAAGFSGSDSFGYTVSDGKGGTANSTVSVTVAPKPNTAPAANADMASTAFATPVSINLVANDSDPDGDTLTVTANTSPANGSVTRLGGSATYTPAAGFSGSDSFGYTVSDGKGGTANSTVSVTVAAAPNQSPVAGADSASTTSPNAVTINLLANDSDPDGDTLSITANTSPANGTVTRSGGTATYTPAAGFSGSDSFGYTVSDGKGGTANGTVSITVQAPAVVNQSPVAGSDTASTTSPNAVTINLLANDSDPDGDTLSVTANTSPANGTVIRSGGSATYTPAAGFAGTDSFGYTVSDGKGGTASGNVTVSVAAAPAPAATPSATTASAVLTWTIPTTRANGSPLAMSELAGYEIYVLAESTGQSSVITVNSGGTSTYTVTGLAPDTYHFSMAAKDSAGNLSELSGVVSKTIAP